MSINKKIYFFWGNKTMSWMRYMTLFSFRKMNPDWDMTLYISEHSENRKTWHMRNLQDFFYYKGDDYLPRISELDITIKKHEGHNLKTPSHASNFFKWDILSTIGGIYSDMDILWFKPIDKFYEQIKDYDVAICQSDFLSIGLLGSSGNKFYSDIYNNTFKNYDKSRYQSAGVESIYDLYKCEQSQVLNKAKKKYPGLRFYNIPMNLVYPFDSKRVDQSFKHSHNILPADSIGYHWYAGHPTSQKYNNLLNEDNYINYDTLFTKIVRERIKQ